MLEDQADLLANLARDIIDHGLSPGEMVWVIPDESDADMYTVLEGNRRITALKVLDTPSIAVGSAVEKKFTNLSKEYAQRSPIREVYGCVFSGREEARPWIRRRHMNAGSGVGLEGWGFMAKGRAMRDEGENAPRTLIVMEALQDRSPEWAQIESALDEKWSTVDRVMNSSSLPKTLGITIDPNKGTITAENGDAQAARSLLRRILAAMADPEFKFKKIEDRNDRENFIGDFAQYAVKLKPAVPRDGRDGGKSGDKGKSGGKEKDSKGGSKKPKADSLARDTLAPKRGPKILPVVGTRLNPLYGECRKIKIHGNENAAALLLRVFIELSSEAYLKTRRVPIPQALKEKGRKRWDEFGIALATKVECVCNNLDPTRREKKFQQARLAIDPGTKGYYSVETLHGYFHNVDLLPDAKDLKRAWDAWESYLFELHTSLNPGP